MPNTQITTLKPANRIPRTLFAIAPLLMLVACVTGATESFDKAPQTPVVKLQTDAGVWTAKPGHAQVRNHPKNNNACLHLLGGTNRSVELTLPPRDKGAVNLTFDAERWTSRSPFQFRVEAFRGGEWQEVYNGDQSVKVGTPLNTKVRIPLKDATITRLRFTSTSPADSGVLIDNVSYEARGPMKVSQVRAVRIFRPPPSLIRVMSTSPTVKRRSTSPTVIPDKRSYSRAVF